MNVPPSHGIRVPAAVLRAFGTRLFVKVGLSHADAELLTGLLVATDLRGVFSHGTRCIKGYAEMILAGRVNPRPKLRIVSETPTTVVIDGDGGMGHLATYRATEMAIAKARQQGVAAATTRNHFHFGSAGRYSRMALEHNCIGLAISSHRYPLPPDASVHQASGGSPFSIAVPSAEQPPLVPDMATSFLPWDPALFEQYPAAFFKELGLAAVMQALGGILAGIYKPEFKPPQSPWESNQGAFIAVFNVSHLMPVAEFKQEMDRYIGEARRMQPLPGYERAELAGGPEWQQEKEYARDGIPISPDHQKALADIATQVGVEAPFTRYESTRF